MRDNMILHERKFDFNALAQDVYGGLFEGFSGTENYGFIVWGEPWSPDAWEVSEGFVRKWGFLLQGCTEIFESTNKWRVSRGEEKLFEQS